MPQIINPDLLEMEFFADFKQWAAGQTEAAASAKAKLEEVSCRGRLPISRSRVLAVTLTSTPCRYGHMVFTLRSASEALRNPGFGKFVQPPLFIVE